jgi:hypothetical protein
MSSLTWRGEYWLHRVNGNELAFTLIQVHISCGWQNSRGTLEPSETSMAMKAYVASKGMRHEMRGNYWVINEISI